MYKPLPVACARQGYNGIHCTYPLLTPLTSLTMTSNVSKSRAVTASKATSRPINDHSKNA
jgi:hypothetical protein